MTNTRDWQCEIRATDGRTKFEEKSMVDACIVCRVLNPDIVYLLNDSKMPLGSKFTLVKKL